MAINFNLPGVPFATTLGMPDIGAALRSGFDTNIKLAEARDKPKSLAEALLAAQLKNKHDQVINQFLPRSEEARIANTEAGTGLLGQQSKYYGPNIESEMALRDMQRRLYGSQAQTAEQELALKKRMMEGLFSPQGQQSSGQYGNEESNQPSYHPDSGMPLYAQQLTQQQNNPSMQQQMQPQSNNPMQNDQQALARKLLGLPAELPHEKMQREISTSGLKEQNKIDLKRAQQLRESAKDLQLAGVDIDGIHDLLTGPDSLGTGITKSLIGKFGLGSEKLGEFNERALRLQAQMARALSSRGGEGAAKIVAGGKPSSWKSTSENLGLTKAYADHVKNEFELLNQEYKNITGKELPYTLPEYVHNISNKIDKNIFKPKTDFNTEKEYHDYMMSLPPEKKEIVIKAIREAQK